MTLLMAPSVFGEPAFAWKNQVEGVINTGGISAGGGG